MNASVTTPRKKARALNAHQWKTSAGFYADQGGRYFQARVKDGKLEVYDWQRWVNADSFTFHDHNGRPIHL